MKTPTIRIEERDGIKIAVKRDTDNNNKLIGWSVSWNGTQPGKRGVSSMLTSWKAVKDLVAKKAAQQPEVTQTAFAGFAL